MLLLERFGCLGGVITTVGMETIGWYRYEVSSLSGSLFLYGSPMDDRYNSSTRSNASSRNSGDAETPELKNAQVGPSKRQQENPMEQMIQEKKDSHIGQLNNTIIAAARKDLENLKTGDEELDEWEALY